MHKEGPILMTPENAQKCALGIKTQTRRVVKWPQWAKPEECAVLLQRSPTGIAYYKDGYPRRRMTCPYGATGDRLWVREAVCEYDLKEYGKSVLYKGACPSVEHYRSLKPIFKPAIHMPRRLCRTLLEIMEVRVERLQAITQLDALHEGCEGPDHKATFFHLWDSIHGAGSWDQNPWVWVLVFHKVSAA